jgi:outer membrane receptor protein involved in Fe transport
MGHTHLRSRAVVASSFIAILMSGTSAFAQSAAASGSASDASAAAAAGAETGGAEAAGAAETAEIQEVIVTAQKRNERLLDVPLSITAVTGDALAKAGVKSVGDLQKVAPSLAFTQSPYGAPIYTIRGIGFFDEAVGISPTVSVYIDQVPIPFSRATEGASLDLERVEVLAGPQGTLFGQNSTGGAINYIAAKPTDTFKAGADLSYGRFNDLDLSGFVSGPVSETVRARLAVRHESRDGWQQSTSRDDSLGHVNFSSARLLVDWEPTDTLRLEFGASGWINKSDSQASQFIGYQASAADGGFPGSVAFPNLQRDLIAMPPAPNKARAADWNPNQSFRRDDSFYQLSLRGDLQLSEDITLTSISAYSKLEVSAPSDVDGTQFPVLGIRVESWTGTFSQELRLAGSAGGDDRLRWMVGGNYQHDRISDIQIVYNQGSNSGVGPFRYTDFMNDSAHQKMRAAAVFGSVDYKLTDTLTAQASARYTDTKRTLDGCLRDGDGGLAQGFGFLSTIFNGNPHVPGPTEPSFIPQFGCVTLDPVTNFPVDNVHRELKEDNLSWRVGLSWKPDETTMVYANVTRGYKAGSFGTIPAVRPAQYDAVPQEELTAYELGAKSSLLDRKLEVTGALFWYDYKAKQLLAYIEDDFFGSLPGLVSVPSSRAKGAEFSLVARPVTGLTLSAAGTYVDTEVRSDFITLPPVGLTFFNAKGQPFPNTPKWSFVADADYHFPVAENWRGFVGANLTYKDKTNSTFGGGRQFQTPDYTLIDARLGAEREDGSLRVTAWVRNLTGKYYWTHVDHVLDTIDRVAGMPRTYGVTVSSRF